MSVNSETDIYSSPLWTEHMEIINGRISKKMEEMKVDALIALSAENFYYSSGFPSYFLYSRRAAGLSLAIHFKNTDKKPVLILNEFEAASLPEKIMETKEVITYPIWVDVDDPFNVKGEKYKEKRPISFDINDIFNKLKKVLYEKGISGGKIATELGIMQYPAWKALHYNLKNVEFVDTPNLFTELRSIKTKWEIELLKRTAALAESGIEKSAEIAKIGVTAAELGAKYKTTIMRDPNCISSRLNIISIGDDFAPRRSLSTNKGKNGDILKYDVGADIGGYGSDLARTFVLGEAHDNVKQIYESLRIGHDKLLDMAGPGVSMSKIFNETMETIKQSGLESYNRGHLGHSVGLTIEEPPFISPSEKSVLEPGMVLCLETPYYGYGVGAIMIEDMILINDNGYEKFNKLSRDLISLT